MESEGAGFGASQIASTKISFHMVLLWHLEECQKVYIILLLKFIQPSGKIKSMYIS